MINVIAALAISVAAQPQPQHPAPEWLVDLVCDPTRYTWPCTQALNISFCESSYDPTKSNAGNYGLFAINRIHYHGPLSDLYNPELNVQMAHDLYQRRGWQPWQYCRAKYGY